LKSSFKTDNKNLILDLWVYCKIAESNAHPVSVTKSTKKAKVVTEAIAEESLSFKINLYPLIEKYKDGLYQLPTARKNQTVLESFNMIPKGEDRISLAFLREVVGNSYCTITSDVGKESQLFILLDNNSRQGKKIGTDDVLWETIN